jgi:hypothetical protein
VLTYESASLKQSCVYVAAYDGYGKNIATGDVIDSKDSQAVHGRLLFKLNNRQSVLVAGDCYRSHEKGVRCNRTP